jgi:hypothetical protein
VSPSILAYLDAGTGSLIVQLLAGGFAAVAVAAKLYWRHLLSFLHIRRENEPETAEPESSA